MRMSITIPAIIGTIAIAAYATARFSPQTVTRAKHGAFRVKDGATRLKDSMMHGFKK